MKPYFAKFAYSLDEMLADVDTALLESTITPGQQVVLVCGYPVGGQRPPNMALLHTVGSDATVNLARKLAENNIKKKQ